MEELPQFFEHFLVHYGAIGLFILLLLGIVAFPIPEETLMIFAGVLISKQILGMTSTLFAAYLGSMFGITISYYLGRTGGVFLVHKYGKYLGLTDSKLQKAHEWFEHLGKWTLVFGYFIPGVRHFTGFCAGVSLLEYRYFALFAYIGALLWVSTFISLGYFFGKSWVGLFRYVMGNLDFFFDIVAVIFIPIVLYFLFRKLTSKKIP
jgi:membrane protein DedA with SNARE-associated domain